MFDDMSWAVANRVREQIRDDRLSVVAGGVAFYGFLSLFPALTAFVSIWGLLADPGLVAAEIDTLGWNLPSSTRELLIRSAERIAGSSTTSLGWSTAVSIALALWSSNKGIKGLLVGIGIAYDDDERRGFWRENLLSLGLTVGAILTTVVFVGAIVVIPVVLSLVGLGAETEALIELGRWPLLAMLFFGGTAMLYRVAPCRRNERASRVMAGSAAATVLWVAASVAFSVYVENFGSYEKTYGALAAVVILLVWLLISAYFILLGAELNAELGKTRRAISPLPAR